jgi:hypothetical protein
MSLNKDTARRLIIALSGQQAGNNAIGAIGLYGGAQLGASAAVAGSTGDFVLIPNSGGAPGTYRFIFADPTMNPRVSSIDWFEVLGFTPRNPTAVETAAALVTGYNYDTTLNQWYVTVQVVSNTSWAVLSDPPTGFVVSIRMAVSFQPAANSI